MRDYKNLEREINKLTVPTSATIRQIIALLPDTKTMRDPDACKHIDRIVAEQSGINDLQKAMAQFSHRIAVCLPLTRNISFSYCYSIQQMEEKGLIGKPKVVLFYII
jgi:hypothetical protein